MKPISVLVEIKGYEVHIQELVTSPHGLALSERNIFSRLGSVREAQIAGSREGAAVNGWRWESEGFSGETKTKAAAVAAMLADAGYAQVQLTATIPDLLATIGGI